MVDPGFVAPYWIWYKCILGSLGCGMVSDERGACCPGGKIGLRPMHRDMRDKGGSGEPSTAASNMCVVPISGTQFALKKLKA